MGSEMCIRDRDIASRKKGICHIWSRGRHFSPSLPVAWFALAELESEVAFGSKSREAPSSYRSLAPSPEVLPLVPDFVEMKKRVKK